MIQTARKAWDWLSDQPHQLMGLRVLQGAIGAMLLFRLFTEIRFTSYLYGPHGLGRGTTADILGSRLGGVLDFAFRSEVGVVLMMLVLGLGALGLLFGYRTRLATLLALVPFFMMERRLPELGDGGDNITRLVLVYMLFALGHRESVRAGSLRVWLHNIAILAIAAQLLILYETSGIMKVMGEKWHDGIAMYYITQVDWFGHPFFHEIFKNPVVVTLGSLAPVIFLVFFPFAIFTRLKLPWIFFGILFHCGIAVSMGLVSFATVMIGLELFLLTDREFARLRLAFAGLRGLRSRVRGNAWFAGRKPEQRSAALLAEGFGSSDLSLTCSTPIPLDPKAEL